MKKNYKKELFCSLVNTNLIKRNSGGKSSFFLSLLVCLITLQAYGQQVNFTEVSNVPFVGINRGGVAFADIDGDGDQDVLITGADFNNSGVTKLYKNDGSGNFTLVTSTPFEAVIESSATFGDIDGDGDEDVVIIGYNSTSRGGVSKLYTNDGNGNFTEVTSASLTGVYSGTAVFGDIDGDRDLDLLITGSTASNARSTKLYINNGSGNFTASTSSTLQNLGFSSAAFGDIDGDGDSDLVLTGEVAYIFPNSVSAAKVYKNNGSGIFTEATNPAISGSPNGSIALADIDNDGDLDLITTGNVFANSSTGPKTIVYTNDGSGNFTLLSYPLSDVFYSSIAVADVDGDGNLDLLITGKTGLSQPSTTPSISVLYRGSGSATFTQISNLPFEGVGYSSAAFSDVNGDGRVDVLLTGQNNNNQLVSKLYLNSTCVASMIDSTVTHVNDSTLHANATGNYSYQWVDCNNNFSPIQGATNQDFEATQNGSYAVQITTPDSCSITSDCSQITGIGGGGIGIASIEQERWQVYPNPTNGYITLKTTEVFKNMPVEVYSPLGRLIYQANLSGKKLTIDLNKYPAGIYIIRLNYNDNIKVIKH